MPLPECDLALTNLGGFVRPIIEILFRHMRHDKFGMQRYWQELVELSQSVVFLWVRPDRLAGQIGPVDRFEGRTPRAKASGRNAASACLN
jgi:hypothetical protein